jgi:protease IV
MWIIKDRNTRHYAKLELKGTYQEIGVQVITRSDLAPHKNFRFDFFYEQIELILARKSIRRVIVHRWENFSVPAFGGLEEIRAALQRLTDAGKEVYYYAPEYDSSDCFLSSACSRRVLHPLGKVSFLGKAISSVFFKKLLDKYSVDVTVIRRDRYKSAADSFRGEKYDEYARRQYQDLLDGLVESMRKAITGSSKSNGNKGFSEKILDEMLDGRIFTAPEALEAGMVDDLRTIDDLTNQCHAEKIRRKSSGKVLGRFGSGARVAVLVFEGMIVEGGSRRSPVFGQAIGDRPMVKLIRNLRRNRKIKAVVFRINSNGGSAVASENILRELVALHKTKPLVISLGPVAGSGGYWISTTGRRLFALPTTITGSIGVLSILFNFAKFLQNHGLTTDSIKHGESADLGSALRPLTDKEKKIIDKNIDFLYRKFLDRVAEFRNCHDNR